MSTFTVRRYAMSNMRDARGMSQWRVCRSSRRLRRRRLRTPRAPSPAPSIFASAAWPDATARSTDEMHASPDEPTRVCVSRYAVLARSSVASERVA